MDFLEVWLSMFTSYIVEELDSILKKITGFSETRLTVSEIIPSNNSEGHNLNPVTFRFVLLLYNVYFILHESKI
jgi:hypothetical protein